MNEQQEPTPSPKTEEPEKKAAKKAPVVPKISLASYQPNREALDEFERRCRGDRRK
jgi:hypothetical protein